MVVGHLFARLARAGRRHRIAARPYPGARFPRAPFPRRVSLISMEPDAPLRPPATPPLESRPGGAVARGITAPCNQRHWSGRRIVGSAMTIRESITDPRTSLVSARQRRRGGGRQSGEDRYRVLFTASEPATGFRVRNTTSIALQCPSLCILHVVGNGWRQRMNLLPLNARHHSNISGITPIKRKKNKRARYCVYEARMDSLFLFSKLVHAVSG